MENSDTAPSLWDFACGVYQLPEVDAICIRLQDGYRVDIPLLLFCFWEGTYHGVMPEALIEKSLALVKQYQVVIKPLRKTRRQMKKIHNASDDQWFSLREEIKALELKIEKALLDNLEQLTERYSQRVCSNGLSFCVSHNLKQCFPNTYVKQPDARSLFEQLLEIHSKNLLQP